ncbi:PQQ-dependent dehydrogenase, methanol/ethanol family [Acidobacteria bacterium AH-259-A15]|nr:PQQ-dependent dehydrogenase, methanol/ethanol family [Acidobacteria bacterium AH-259-A15]
MRKTALLTVTLACTMTFAAGQQVSYQRILEADKEPGNWLTYSRTYDAQRFSPLNQITAANVSRLQPAWIYQLQTTHKVETTPLVVDGMMYLTRPPNHVIALDAETGRKFWEFRYQNPPDVIACCGQVNRGLAILGDRLFMNTLDSMMLALDVKSGRVLWKTKMADYKAAYAATTAPLAVKDKVITGVAGAEYGIRGFIDAYDAETGKRVWRFYTVPGPGEPGNETWEGNSWKTGGASIWVTGSYDPELNLTYWGAGNPGPDYNGDVRKGDNLYSDSVVALDVDTGKLKWHFQFTPHDVHDFDAAQVPVLADIEFGGRLRKLMLFPNRNAFFYVLDRVTGEFLLAKAFAKQTWAKGIDAKGRPIRMPNTTPTKTGTRVWPAASGAANWHSPTFSPHTGFIYVAAREGGETFYKADVDYKPGSYFLGGEHKRIRSEPNNGGIRAIDPQTGKIRWEFPVITRPYAGLMSTAGNLVFGGTDEGHFLALNAKTGQHLWHFPAGGRVRAAPITYLAKGKQYVAISSGDILVSFTLKD